MNEIELAPDLLSVVVAKTLADLDDAERELLRQLVGKRAGGE